MTLKEYLIEYSQSHQHPINILIHKFCVPLIMFSLLGILKALPVPLTWPLWLDWSTFLIAGAMIFYIKLKNVRVVMALTIFLGIQLLILEALRPRFFLLCVGLFILSWIGQFIGHKIEGRKSSFFKDLLFLLIGPIWTLKTISDQIGHDLFKINNATET